MIEESKISIAPQTAQELRDWICELLEYSDCLFRNECGEAGAVDDFLQEESHTHNPYARYLEEIHFSCGELEDIAEVIVDAVVKRGTRANIILSMTQNRSILLDDEKSMRWLRPFAEADRTSVAYQRGLALERLREYNLARAFMLEAAENGDVDCTMHLIEQKIKGAVNGFVDEEPEVDDFPLIVQENASVAYECGLAWIKYGNVGRAQIILQKGADKGYVDCALYLIENMILTNYKYWRGPK